MRFGDLLEALRRVRSPVYIGVELPGELAIGAADLFVRRAPRDAQQREVVACRRHHLPLSRPMDVLPRLALQWLHATAAVLCTGGGFPTTMAQPPALLAAA